MIYVLSFQHPLININENFDLKITLNIRKTRGLMKNCIYSTFICILNFFTCYLYAEIDFGVNMQFAYI